MSWEVLLGPFDLNTFVIVTTRIIAAILLGAVIGLDREKARRPAGFRTHILVCLGTMLFVLIPNIAGFSDDSESRSIQAIGAFIGALALGTVLKREEKEVVGLTTAISFVPMAGIGIAIGHGYIWIAVLVTFAVWFVLRILKISEENITSRDERGDTI